MQERLLRMIKFLFFIPSTLTIILYCVLAYRLKRPFIWTLNYNELSAADKKIYHCINVFAFLSVLAMAVRP